LITRLNVLLANFGTRSKALIMQNNAFKTFDLVPKSVRPTFGTRSKFLIMVFKFVRTDFGTRSKVKDVPKIPLVHLSI
jgi:hypothetical protein